MAGIQKKKSFYNTESQQHWEGNKRLDNFDANTNYKCGQFSVLSCKYH